jgi:hypothetical protein
MSGMAKEKFEMARLTLTRDNVAGVQLVVGVAALTAVSWSVAARRVLLRAARAIVRR